MQDDILEWSRPKRTCENFKVFSEYRKLCWGSCSKITSKADMRLQIQAVSWNKSSSSLYRRTLFLQLPCPMLCLPLLCTNFTSSVLLWTDFTDYSGSKLPWSVECQVFFPRALKYRLSDKDMVRTSDGTKKGGRMTDKWMKESVVSY